MEIKRQQVREMENFEELREKNQFFPTFFPERSLVIKMDSIPLLPQFFLIIVPSQFNTNSHMEW